MADGTELGLFVGAHAAILASAPDTLFQITTSLDKAGLAFLNEIVPFDGDGGLRGEVGFPGLCVGEVHGLVVAVGIFVA